MYKTIDIDCEPFTPRPDTYIADLFEDTSIMFDGREPIAKSFGNWTWDFSDISDKDWLEANGKVKERLIDLYNKGKIRYASW